MKVKVLSALLMLCPMLAAFGQGTAFTYEGRLNDNGAPANGSYDFQFRLYDAATNGSPVPVIPVSPNVLVTNGLFTTAIDFGNNVFNGTVYWLEIAVQPHNGSGFTTLSPRQQITPTPYAIFANTSSNLSGTILASQVSGAAGAATNFTGNLNGDVTGTQSATVVSFVGGQSAANVAGSVVAVNTATDANTANTIIKRDGSGAFSAGAVTADSLNLAVFPPTIYAGGSLLFYADAFSRDLFAGLSAGNFGGGSDNVAVGYNALSANRSSIGNTAVGSFALARSTNGPNTAFGSGALNFNSSGIYNTATGVQTLNFNTNGNYNTADGELALYGNQSGSFNTATGGAALYWSTNGNNNTADGYQALYFNTSASDNTASGAYALFRNTTGGDNTATGYSALSFNTNGNFNVAEGENALLNNTSGSHNAAFGTGALSGSKGDSNIGLGDFAGANITTGSNNICIGNGGTSADTNIIRIGSTQSKTFIAGITGVTLTGSTVVVTATGQLGVSGTSSARFKQDIRTMENASDVLLSLRPVTFEYRPEIDPQGIPQFGLVAEEVAKVDPDLVLRDQQGRPNAVRYEAVNAMLLNEFLKQHKTVEEQSARIRDLQARLEKLEQRADRNGNSQ